MAFGLFQSFLNDIKNNVNNELCNIKHCEYYSIIPNFNMANFIKLRLIFYFLNLLEFLKSLLLA